MSVARELLERWLDDTIFEPEELDSLMEETRELLAQPEQNRQLDDLMKSRPGGLIRLKRKRVEPLSNEEVDSLWSETETIYDFAKAIEKVYGIGVPDEYIAPSDKMHGIGGV